MNRNIEIGILSCAYKHIGNKIKSIEVRPCKQEGTNIEQCEESDAELFGVYGRCENGLGTWLADTNTRAESEKLKSLLECIL